MAPSNVENFSPHVIKQISRELCDLTQNPVEGVRVVFNEDDITSVQADIDGPSGTPYFGGSFRIRLVLGKNFPTQPPKGFFATKIFHPNVGKNGEICVNTLKKDWNQDLGLKHILLTIKCLLIVPNPESALNEEAGKMLLEQYDDYFKRAKMMTEIHAPRARIVNHSGSTSEGCNQQHEQSQASSSSVNNSSSSNNNNNINTLYDKTASTSTNIAQSGTATTTTTNGGSQKQPLDGVCCSDEPVTKRLNTMLDCYNNSTTTDQQQPMQQQQKSAAPSQSSKGSTNAISNKNRGLKRVLRLRS